MDFNDHDNAKVAAQSCAGFRFQGANKGINVRFSDNNKRDGARGNGSVNGSGYK